MFVILLIMYNLFQNIITGISRIEGGLNPTIPQNEL
jgi:hypothetical protein